MPCSKWNSGRGGVRAGNLCPPPPAFPPPHSGTLPRGLSWPGLCLHEFSTPLGPITFIANLFWGSVLVAINHSFRALYLTLQERVCVGGVLT